MTNPYQRLGQYTQSARLKLANLKAAYLLSQNTEDSSQFALTHNPDQLADKIARLRLTTY